MEMAERFVNCLFVSQISRRHGVFHPLAVMRRHLLDMGRSDMGHVVVDLASPDDVEVAVRGVLAASDTLPDIVFSTMECAPLQDRLPAPLALVQPSTADGEGIIVEMGEEVWATPRIDGSSVRALSGMYTLWDPVLILPEKGAASLEARELTLLLGMNRTVRDTVTPSDVEWKRLRHSRIVLVDEAVEYGVQWQEACVRAGKSVVTLRSDTLEIRPEIVSYLLEGDGAMSQAVSSASSALGGYLEETSLHVPVPPLEYSELLHCPQLEVRARVALRDVHGYLDGARFDVFLGSGHWASAAVDIGALDVASGGLLYGRADQSGVVVDGWTRGGSVHLSICIPSQYVLGASTCDLSVRWDRRVLDYVQLVEPLVSWSVSPSPRVHDWCSGADRNP